MKFIRIYSSVIQLTDRQTDRRTDGRTDSNHVVTCPLSETEWCSHLETVELFDRRCSVIWQHLHHHHHHHHQINSTFIYTINSPHCPPVTHQLYIIITPTYLLSHLLHSPVNVTTVSATASGLSQCVVNAIDTTSLTTHTDNSNSYAFYSFIVYDLEWLFLIYWDRFTINTETNSIGHW